MSQHQQSKKEKPRKKKALLVLGSIILCTLILGGTYYIYYQQEQIAQIQELSTLEKEQLQEEYNDLVLQYEGFKFSVKNDSLLNQLASEQAKVQRLKEELRTVKASNANQIIRLKKELTALRKVLRNYVIQIDSLNRANQALRTENKEVKQRISQVTSQKKQLQAEKEKLTNQVQLAAKLSISSITVRGLNSRGKETKRIQSMKQLEFRFQLDRNVTTTPGIKKLCLRITKPDGTLLSQPAVSGVFPFEGSNVPYSVARSVEYGGEPIPIVIYWDIQEYLVEGEYEVEFFSEGYRIGKKIFTL